jgi:hypothetical protein
MIQITRREIPKKTMVIGVPVKVDDKIVEVPIGDVIPWKNNPRKNDAAAPKLAEVISARGQITPIVVWRKNMVAYKGNTTIKAMQLLNQKTIRVLFADFPSEAAAVAYGIADNKSSEWAEWDEAVLQKFFTTPEIVKSSGFSEIERRALFFEPEPENIKKINAANIGLKDKIVVVVLDVAKKDLFKDMLTQWVKSIGFEGIEIR